jgi:phospholipid transport system substrate-binding protein
MLRFCFLSFVAVLCSTQACAQQASPDDVVRSAVEGVLTTIKADPAAKNGDVTHIAQLVEQKFLPYTDFLHTTRLAVGAPWQAATAEQQKAVFEQFQTLLVRTYALELTQISDQDIKFQYGPPAKPGASGDVIVKTRMLTSSDDDEIDYRLAKTPSGWRIYDINILGAWLSTLYRNQFAGRLAQGGMDGLTEVLRQHNSRNTN